MCVTEGKPRTWMNRSCYGCSSLLISCFAILTGVQELIPETEVKGNFVFRVKGRLGRYVKEVDPSLRTHKKEVKYPSPRTHTISTKPYPTKSSLRRTKNTSFHCVSPDTESFYLLLRSFCLVNCVITIGFTL